jgi:hypothetical protein
MSTSKDMLFDLPGDISLTPAVVDKIREGYSRVHDIIDPVGSIAFVTPQDESQACVWSLIWFSRQHAPAQLLFKVQDVDVAISEDAQEKLRGKLIDFREGRLVVTDQSPHGKRS